MPGPDQSDRRVLVLVDDVRSFLSVVRSLGRMGLTADVITSTVQEFLKSGAAAVAGKPVELPQLRRAVAAAMGIA